MVNILKYSLLASLVGLSIQAQARDVSMKDADTKTWKVGDMIDGVCEILSFKEDESHKSIHVVCKDGTKVTVEATYKPAAEVKK